MAEAKLCAAPDCGKSAHGTYCFMHRARLARGGTLEPRQPVKTINELLGGRTEIGWWTILGPGEPYQRKTSDGANHPDGRQRTAQCRCDCGKVRDIAIQTLKQGMSRHCGCKMAIINPEIHGTHRMSGTPEYRTWAKMKERCTNPNYPDWGHYGGRGIRVCAEWMTSFEEFFAYIGPKPDPSYSIDRIDVNGNYEPGNVRWADNQTQAENKRTTRYVDVDGERMPLIAACRKLGINYKLVHARMQKGQSFEEAHT